MGDRNRYLEEAQRVLEKAKLRLGVIDQPCSKCKHYRKGWLDPATCSHPIVILAAKTADVRDCEKYIVKCDEQRSVRSIWGSVVCGPNGALFEGKD